MKKNKMKPMFFIFLIVLIAGIVLMLIPFNSEEYIISSFNSSHFTRRDESGFEASVYIENKTGETQENVSITIDYIAEHMLDETSHSVSFNNITLIPGENEFNFTYKINDFGIYDLEDVEAVYIYLQDGTCIKAGEASIFSGSNWYFIGMIIIGFFGSIVSLIVWKVVPKVEDGLDTVSESFTSFTERVQEAFKPFSETKLEKETKKFYCSYCKCTFDSKYDKCPHCGAPPERKD